MSTLTSPQVLRPTPPSPQATVRAFWHGGAPGLKLNEFVLPPVATNVPCVLLAYREAGAVVRAGYRPDRVYVSPLLSVAELYAALYPDGGWVYRVLVEEPVEDDPDCTEPGLSYACERGLIIGVFSLHPLTTVRILTDVLEGKDAQALRFGVQEMRSSGGKGGAA